MQGGDRMPVGRATGQGRAGTKGQGTRGGTKRSHSEKLAYDSGDDGVIPAALASAYMLYENDQTLAAICASGGRHQSGLILHRPPRPSCSSGICECDADTARMAAALFANPTKVPPSQLVPTAHARARVRRSVRDAAQVIQWWSTRGGGEQSKRRKLETAHHSPSVSARPVVAVGSSSTGSPTPATTLKLSPRPRRNPDA